MIEVFNSSKIGVVNGNTVYFRSMSHFEAKFHSHENTEEMFIVQSGKLYLDFESMSLEINEGESYTVSKGVVHRARVKELTEVIVISKGLNA